MISLSFLLQVSPPLAGLVHLTSSASLFSQIMRFTEQVIRFLNCMYLQLWGVAPNPISSRVLGTKQKTQGLFHLLYGALPQTPIPFYHRCKKESKTSSQSYPSTHPDSYRDLRRPGLLWQAFSPIPILSRFCIKSVYIHYWLIFPFVGLPFRGRG